jgi:hypothetical protein
MEKVVLAIGAIVVGLVGVLLIGFLLSWPVMMLWNGCLVDAVTGVKEITWLQGGASVHCLACCSSQLLLPNKDPSFECS